MRAALAKRLKPLRNVDYPGFFLLLAIGLAGGLTASFLAVPIPFLVGSLVAVGGFSIVRVARGRPAIAFPQAVRMRFVSVIGAMIGATFTTHILGLLSSLWLSLLAMILYVGVANAAGYAIFRHIGRYDPITALYAAMPGGLIEAVALGEQAGGDVRILSVQQFARIVIVVISVPILFYFWLGHGVGSASGQAFATEAAEVDDIAIILLFALIGFTIGPRLHIPASHMMAPLLLSAIAHATGIVDVTSPKWLLNVSQLVVGAGLGSIFGGTGIRLIVKCIGLGFVAVAVMLSIGLAFALALRPFSAVSGEALFISFAPGGVTEMGLIALSLGVSPVIVATHHLFRILITVLLASALGRSKSFGSNRSP